MTRLIYSVICSLDGYNVDATGSFDWAEPSEEVVAFINEQGRPATTYLYGRRMYETMAVWETDPSAAEISPASAEFARIWQAATKVVFSTTLTSVWTSRTTLERSLTTDVVERIKAEAAGDLYVDGPTLAGSALRLGVVDELQVIVAPVTVGGGTSVYPADQRLDLRLLTERRFDNGMVALTYAIGAR
jgi:dihydrofolate reductase